MFLRCWSHLSRCDCVSVGLGGNWWQVVSIGTIIGLRLALGPGWKDVVFKKVVRVNSLLESIDQLVIILIDVSRKGNYLFGSGSKAIG